VIEPPPREPMVADVPAAVMSESPDGTDVPVILRMSTAVAWKAARTGAMTARGTGPGAWRRLTLASRSETIHYLDGKGRNAGATEWRTTPARAR
jgi:hypothetical protein